MSCHLGVRDRNTVGNILGHCLELFPSPGTRNIGVSIVKRHVRMEKKYDKGKGHFFSDYAIYNIQRL